MPGNKLVIVESPAKAKTIAKYLGDDYTVMASIGHIRDLIDPKNLPPEEKKKKGSLAKFSIDIENDFEPYYAISAGKSKTVSELKKALGEADELYLATDEDREGEAIAWHLLQVLKPKVPVKRMVFHEITKTAIQEALGKTRDVDQNLVQAQETRRVVDRLYGYEVSPVLWRKINRGLSAGRVQSPAMRLVVERERERMAFVSASYHDVKALFTTNVGKEQDFEAKLLSIDGKRIASGDAFNDKGEIKDGVLLLDLEAAEKLAVAMRGKDIKVKVESVESKPSTRRPAAPFTTSTLQQEASRKLRMSAKQTMDTAQSLYQDGHITYMRTDSTNLSGEALKNIENAIVGNYGQQYHKYRTYSSKKGAQEAHEAIRPTYMEKQNVSGDRDEQRLYELIWKRTIASQMADAQLEKTTVDIKISTVNDAILVAVGEVLKFEGFLKVYLESKDEDEDEDSEDTILPPMKKGQTLNLKEMDAIERYTRPPYRYTEAGLVKKLEELGIGRPSTYAPTIEKIMDPTRGYITKASRDGHERPYKVLKLHSASDKKEAFISQENKTEIYGADKNKLFASDLGKQVSDFLVRYFDEIMDYSFTAEIEDQLDKVAEGKIDSFKMLDDVYKPFHTTLLSTMEDAERVTGERILGKHPVSGLSVLVRIGRYGPVAQIGSPEELGEKEKPAYANLHKDQSIDTISMDDVLDLFKFPKTLGQHKGFEVSVNEGRYGPYIKFDEKFISLPKNTDPNSISFEDAIELIDAKLEEDAPVGHFRGLPISKGNGRFGPFVKWDKLFVSITKGSGFQLDTITESQAIQLIEQKIEKESQKYLKEWPEYDLFIESGRWGPFVRSGKKAYKLTDANGKKITNEEVATLTVQQVTAIVEEQGGKVKKPKASKTKK